MPVASNRARLLSFILIRSCIETELSLRFANLRAAVAACIGTSIRAHLPHVVPPHVQVKRDPDTEEIPDDVPPDVEDMLRHVK